MSNDNIFCVTSFSPLGCTFLDWSIHYLSGTDTFYHTTMGELKLSDNPIQQINAHSHIKNHPTGFKNSVDVINELTKVDYNLKSFYPFPLYMDLLAKDLDIPLNQVADNYQQLLKSQIDDYKNILKYCNSKNIPVVYVKLSSASDYTYNCFTRSLERQMLANSPLESPDQSIHELITIFFDVDFKNWPKVDEEMTAWDYREFLSLNLRPHDYTQPDNLESEHFLVDTRDLWFNLEQTILEIFNYLNLKIVDSKINSWKLMYREWQKQHLNILHFCWYLDTIVDNIIKNISLDLTRFDLDIYKEAIIQHELVYKYGLTIKGWGLEKFPNNTQDLYKLLEKNVYHKVENIYGAL